MDLSNQNLTDLMKTDDNKVVKKIPYLPIKTCDRKKNQIYWNPKKKRFDTWSGVNLMCCHFKQRAMCRIMACACAKN